MDDKQALAIVSALANGANPLTGEMFAADSPYQSPDVIRAMFVARQALEAKLCTLPSVSVAPLTEARTPSSTNAGKPWTNEEDRQLLAAFDADKPLTEIAKTHSRTVGGVRARLEKHGRLDPSPATRWPQNGKNQTNSRAEHRAK